MTTLQEMYASLGIDAQVLAFGEHILGNLKDRFAAIDETAEYNQLKVIRAMQQARVSEACLLGTTGYGYNDIGRDTLEEVYACSMRRMHWSDHRSPVAHMHWHWH